MVTGEELINQLNQIPAGQRTSLENLLCAAVSAGRIHIDGAATTELAQLRADKAELLFELKYWIEDGRFLVANTPEYDEAVADARAAIAKHGG